MSIVLFFVVFLSGGCKKKETSRALVLAPPEKAFSSIGQPGTEENVPAEAEVKASSGPVELTLRIYKKRVSRGADSLWGQLVLRNIGKERIQVADEAFTKPGALVVREGYGVHLELVDARGKHLDGCLIPGGEPIGGGLLEPDSPAWPQPAKDSKDPEGDRKRIEENYWKWGENIRKRQALWDDLEKKKVPKKEFYRRLDEFEKQHGLARPIKIPKWFWLAPDSSTATLPWADRESYHPALPGGILVNGKPVGGYAETQIECLYPGEYRIRAVYDRSQSKLATQYRVAPNAWNVVVETPYVGFEVAP